MAEQTAEQLNKRQSKLFQDRQSTWDNLWDELAELAMPRRQPVTTKGQTQLKGQETLDVTAKQAVQEFAAGLYGYLTPPTERWFALQPVSDDTAEGEEDDDKKEKKQEYFHELTEKAYQLLATSNFYEKIHPNYVDLAWAGTAALYSEEDPLRPGELRFESFTPYDYAFATNYLSEPDTVFVQFSYSPRQAAQRFGKDNIAEKERTKLDEENEKADEEHTYIHCVYPREQGKPDAENAMEMPFESVWLDVENSKIVKESGYRELPYHIARYAVANGEKYGTSPTRVGLELIAFTNSQRRSLARASQRAAEPPWLVPSDGSTYNVSNKPNAIIYWQPDPGGMNQPSQLEYRGQLNWTMEDYKLDRDAINSIYHVDLFRALTHMEGDRRTATEVERIVSEQQNMLSPFLGRLNRELFDRLITRVVNLMFTMGIAPSPPDEIADDINTGNIAYEINYQSQLALALKAQGITGFRRTIQVLAPLAELSPGVLSDNFDIDTAARAIGRGNGVPSNWMRSAEQVQNIQAQRRRQQQLAQLAEKGPEALEKLSKAPEEGSPAQDLMNQITSPNV